MKKSKKESRTLYAIKNIIFNFLYQLINTITNIIIPPLLISKFGSAINGLISTIKQIINYIQIVGSGISESTTVSLYKPLEENDTNKISEIYKASEKTFNRAGFIFSIISIIIAFIYPLFINDDLNYFFVVKIIIILSISGASEFFALGKYRTLLIADQKNYIVSISQIIGTLLSTIFIYVFIKLNFNILVVQFISVLFYVSRILILYIYIHKNYKYINKNAKADYFAVSKRKAAMIHQIASLIIFGSQTVFIASWCGLKEASVYSVYNLVFTGINTILATVSTAMISGIGRLMNSKEKDRIINIYNIYEFCYYIMVFTFYVVAFSLCLPFVKLYITGVTDVNYTRGELVLLFTIMGLLNCLRTPGATLINAKGHYEETKYRAIIEMVICLVGEILLTSKLGIVGILISTIMAYLYRTIDVIIYSNKHILLRSSLNTLKRVFINLIFFVIMVLVIDKVMIDISNYLVWLIVAVILTIIVFIIELLINYIFDKKTFNNAKTYFINIFRRKI